MTRREATPAVELTGIARRFGRRWPLRGVTLRVNAGEAVVVTGRNGSGKTTLLRIVATLLRPTRGTGAVFGCDLVGASDAVRERVAFLGHAPGVYPDLTAAENLRFVRRMLGRSADVGAVESALESVGLAREADRRVRGFSAGMQRRLALARVMLRSPRLLLLDEPYASFDSDGVERVNAFVRMMRERGGAVLIATHNVERARNEVDRVVRIETGRLRADAVDAGAMAAAGGDVA